MLLIASAAALGDDWPQWLGPRRDGVWRETGLIDAFPKAGLPVRWHAPIGGGYAGPAVADGRVFVTDYLRKPDVNRPRDPFKRITQPGTERVLCFDEFTGKPLWTYAYDCDYSMSYSAGPRTTPAVDGDRVYTLGAEGDLVCLDVSRGTLIWSKHLSTPQMPTPNWGFDGHPLIDGDKVIVNSGGTSTQAGRGVFSAYNKMTGTLIWTALAAREPGYAPPMIYTAAGARQLIAWDPQSINSLDPQTGKVYWTHKFGPLRVGLSVMTPRFIHDPKFGDLLMVATQYEGSLVLRLDKDAAGHPSASVFWKRGGKSDRKTDALHILIAPPTLRDGHIYGIGIKGELRCLDLSNGDRLWSTFDATTYDAGQQQWATAFLIPLGDHGDRFLIANEHGDLLLSTLNSAGYHTISRTHVLDPTNTDPGRPVLWCYPALANRCVFWRNDKEIVCADMSAGKR